jgi:hypothetical protein
LLWNWTREETKDQRAHHDGRTQHNYTHVLSGGKSCVSEEATQQAKGRTACAEREIHALPRTARKAYEPGENGGHNQINRYEYKVGRSPLPVQDTCPRRDKAVDRDAQKRDRMNERNQGPLAIREYPKIVHILMIKFRRGKVDFPVIRCTSSCDSNHEIRTGRLAPP